FETATNREKLSEARYNGTVFQTLLALGSSRLPSRRSCLRHLRELGRRHVHWLRPLLRRVPILSPCGRCTTTLPEPDRVQQVCARLTPYAHDRPSSGAETGVCAPLQPVMWI